MTEQHAPGTALSLPLAEDSAIQAREAVMAWAAPTGLAGKPLARLVQAVDELAESTAVLARVLQIEGELRLSSTPYTGWLTVTLAFPAAIPLDPAFDQKDAALDELPGLAVMPDIFWRRLILGLVDKAEWTQSRKTITISLTQYARPEDRPGELYFLGLTPRPAPNLGLEMMGDGLAVAVAPHSKAAFRLPGQNAFVLQAADGKTRVREIYTAFVKRFGMVHPTTVGNIVEDLAQRGLIITGDPVADAPQTRVSRLRALAAKALSFQYSIPSPDGFVEAVNRGVGGLWSPVAAGIMLFVSALALALAGTSALPQLMGQGGFTFDMARAPGPALAFFLGLNLAISLHELSHAIVCKRLGGRIHAFGLMVYCGLVCPFVDTTDAWMFTSKWRRAAVSLAGPACDFVCSAIAMSLAVLMAAQGQQQLAEAMTALALFLATMMARNLLPILQVDGYYALSDLLDIPNLRPRSFAAIRGLALALAGIGTRKPADYASEWKFAAYGLVCVAGATLLFGVAVSTFLLDNLEKLRGPVVWILGAVFAVWLVHILTEAGRNWYRRTRLKTLNLKSV